MFTSSADLLRSIVAGKFFLKKVVGGGDDDALFLADAPDGSPVNVRLVPDGAPVAGTWSAVVEASARLIHPHLLRYIESGECRLDGQPWQYLVTEAVSDRVDEVLLERPLNPDEADAVLRAALLAVSHLHDNGYVHGGLQPGAVVAASDLIKLTGETIAPLPEDETAARRAVSAELLSLGETATELLTRAKSPGAAASLPAPFAAFVRSTAGTSACPHPTAMQLMDVLDGKELAPAPSVAAVSASALAAKPLPDPEPEPRAPEPKVEDWSEVRRDPARRNGTVLLAMLGIAVLSLMVWFVRRPKATPPAPVPTAAALPAPATRPAPLPPAAKSTRIREAPAVSTTQGQWSVIAATYGDYGAALKRATQLASRSKQVHPIVLPPPGQGKRYYVVLGTASSRKEADLLRSQARAAGMPGDTYVTRLQF